MLQPNAILQVTISNHKQSALIALLNKRPGVAGHGTRLGVISILASLSGKL